MCMSAPQGPALVEGGPGCRLVCDVARPSLQILPGVKVIIAHTETKGPLGDSHLGEVRLGGATDPHPRLLPPILEPCTLWDHVCFWGSPCSLGLFLSPTLVL